jgi:hypothetical protein
MVDCSSAVVGEDTFQTQCYCVLSETLMQTYLECYFNDTPFPPTALVFNSHFMLISLFYLVLLLHG